jgi:predicted alpha/beta-fold hydrolase
MKGCGSPPGPLRAEPPSTPLQVTPFRRAWWLPGAHAQTIGGRFLRRLDQGPLDTERVELPDGDFVDLHETPSDLPSDAPVTLILHGLEGSSRANYVTTLARELAGHGIRAVRLNFRACSGEMNRLPRFYHAGDTGDLDFVVNHLRGRAPGALIALAGFSLGGNVLLKYLGERGSDATRDIVAAAAVSVPFDLAAGTRNLERPGMTRIYTLYFMRKLRAKALHKREVLADLCDVEGALAARTVREYDEAATARLHGFRDAWHYYEQSSSHSWLDQIRLPTLVLHSLDDPFQPADVVPVRAVRENPWLVDGITASGGHVGFITGSPWRPVFWAEREAARFIARRFAGSSHVSDSHSGAGRPAESKR